MSSNRQPLNSTMNASTASTPSMLSEKVPKW